MDSNKLSKEFLAERDTRIFGLKKSGVSNQDIGRRFNMTASAVAAATRRQLGRLNSDAWLSYPEVLRLELERLDELQKAVWPLTQFRREVLDDGSDLMVEPDQNAVRTVLGIMDRRAKLLGMNVERSEVAISGLEGREVVDVTSSLAGAVVVKEVGGDPRGEALALLELMASSGVLDSGVVNVILDSVDHLDSVDRGLADADVIDAVIIEEGESNV
jgi:hypothetical protein